MQNVWNNKPPDDIPPDDNVHIWRYRLAVGDSVREALSRVLDDDELSRARRFHFKKHQEHFIVARAQLRHILCRYTGLSPASIEFEFNAYGKPYLKSKTELFFNLSHSHEMALVGICRKHEIGIDIEVIKERQATFKIAKRFFSKEEVNDLMSLTEDQRISGFFKAWTRKEAYIKGKGKGLAIPLGSFTVTLAPGVPARLLSDINDPGAPQGWSFSDLSVDEDYTAAVAVCKPQHQYMLWSLY